MKLPNADKAIIDREKVVDYLLNVSHRRGGSKARLFNSLGYNAAQWQQLVDDIRTQHLIADVVDQSTSVWGERFEIVAPLTGPNGDTVMFRSVWQIDLGSEAPRLITIYPE